MKSKETIVNREETSKDIILYVLRNRLFLIMSINSLVLLSIYCDLLNAGRGFVRYLTSRYDTCLALEIIAIRGISSTELTFFLICVIGCVFKIFHVGYS